MTSYKETIEYLYSLQNFGIKLGLTNISALLKKLSMPHQSYKTIHIAGTNGKGSTAAAMESVLIESGYSVGLYTSPHLVDFRERIRVNGEEIDEESVVNIAKLVKEKKDELKINCEITFFEYVTAIAFYYFMAKNVEIAIIEVGMGGRLDATNVITPMVSVITGVSMEHQQYLGNTVQDIAGEKAGIIKKRIPVISGARDERVKGVIRDAAKSKNATLYEIQRDFVFTSFDTEKFDYAGIYKSYTGIKKGLLGAHQFYNFSVALAALELIGGHGFPVDESCIRKGFDNVKWAGRFEIFSFDPLIILDGAHNDKSMEAAVNTLKENFAGKKVISVIGVVRDKDIKSIAKHISDISDTVILTKPGINRACDPLELAEYFDRGSDVIQVPDVKDAIEYAKRIYDKDSLIFVSGSLFTVGDAIK